MYDEDDDFVSSMQNEEDDYLASHEEADYFALQDVQDSNEEDGGDAVVAACHHTTQSISSITNDVEANHDEGTSPKTHEEPITILRTPKTSLQKHMHDKRRVGVSLVVLYDEDDNFADEDEDEAVIGCHHNSQSISSLMNDVPSEGSEDHLQESDLIQAEKRTLKTILKNRCSSVTDTSTVGSSTNDIPSSESWEEDQICISSPHQATIAPSATNHLFLPAVPPIANRQVTPLHQQEEKAEQVTPPQKKAENATAEELAQSPGEGWMYDSLQQYIPSSPRKLYGLPPAAPTASRRALEFKVAPALFPPIK